MTLEIAFLFVLLAGMVYLFLTEKLPVELTAFLGLLILVFTGYAVINNLGALNALGLSPLGLS